MAKYKIGEICQIVSGSTPKTSVNEYWDGNIKWITPAEISEDTYIVNDSERKISELAVEKKHMLSFPKGTVILSSRAPIGKVAIAGCEMYCNQGFKNLICSNVINNKYLYWFLKGKKDFLNSLGRGATFKEISKSIISKIEIEVPSKEKQEDIVEILEKINIIIKDRNREICALDDLIKARFVEMFGNPEQNEKKWKICRLGDKCKVINGRAYKASELCKHGKYKVLRVGNFFTNDSWYYSDLELEDDKYCKEGDLLFAWSASFGPRIWHGEKAIYHYHIWKLSGYEKWLDKDFFVELLNYNCEVMRRSTHGSTMLHFTKNQMENQQLILPPIELQNQFADFVHQVDKSKVASDKQLKNIAILLVICSIIYTNLNGNMGRIPYDN